MRQHAVNKENLAKLFDIHQISSAAPLELAGIMAHQLP